MERKDRDFDINQLLYPAEAFETPGQVVNDPDLTLNEKRAILASWASDACAIEASPELRETPSGSRVKYDEIMESLRKLDGEMVDADRYRKLVRRAGLFKRMRGEGQGGQPLQ